MKRAVQSAKARSWQKKVPHLSVWQPTPAIFGTYREVYAQDGTFKTSIFTVLWKERTLSNVTYSRVAPYVWLNSRLHTGRYPHVPLGHDARYDMWSFCHSYKRYAHQIQFFSRFMRSNPDYHHNRTLPHNGLYRLLARGAITHKGHFAHLVSILDKFCLRSDSMDWAFCPLGPCVIANIPRSSYHSEYTYSRQGL